jgi:hypothetical protein
LITYKLEQRIINTFVNSDMLIPLLPCKSLYALHLLLLLIYG